MFQTPSPNLKWSFYPNRSDWELRWDRPHTFIVTAECVFWGRVHLTADKEPQESLLFCPLLLWWDISTITKQNLWSTLTVFPFWHDTCLDQLFIEVWGHPWTDTFIWKDVEYVENQLFFYQCESTTSVLFSKQFDTMSLHSWTFYSGDTFTCYMLLEKHHDGWLCVPLSLHLLISDQWKYNTMSP